MILILLAMFSSLAFAHGTEKTSTIVETQNTVLVFSTEPKYPVTGKEIHLHLIVNDKDGKPVEGLQIEFELHNNKEETITKKIALKEKNGEYSVTYSFTEIGNYELHTRFEYAGEEIEKKFSIDVDGLALDDFFSLGITFLLIGGMIVLGIKECWRRKQDA